MAEVNTIYGPMDDSLLQRVETRDEDDKAVYRAVEYYLNGERVHRSVWLDLKRGLDFFTETEKLA